MKLFYIYILDFFSHLYPLWEHSLYFLSCRHNRKWEEITPKRILLSDSCQQNNCPDWGIPPLFQFWWQLSLWNVLITFSGHQDKSEVNLPEGTWSAFKSWQRVQLFPVPSKSKTIFFFLQMPLSIMLEVMEYLCGGDWNSSVSFRTFWLKSAGAMNGPKRQANTDWRISQPIYGLISDDRIIGLLHMT